MEQKPVERAEHPRLPKLIQLRTTILTWIGEYEHSERGSLRLGYPSALNELKQARKNVERVDKYIEAVKADPYVTHTRTLLATFNGLYKRYHHYKHHNYL